MVHNTISKTKSIKEKVVLKGHPVETRIRTFRQSEKGVTGRPEVMKKRGSWSDARRETPEKRA